ncbi:hypothetical protein ACFZAR_22480 [Streptomyces sp. NPDC008222]|uniref:hypothetical protein n=1 Tax=Streptomyces sp. NPDC008222 TaxID=3364820 RepID=UPI0036E2874B
MSSSSTSRPPEPDLRLDRIPILTSGPTDDPLRWAAEHRDTLRTLVTDHGALLVRGLGLRDRTETAAVFRRPATGLMAETEAFATAILWRRRVLVALHNVRTAHSREAYEGQRHVVAALADPVQLADCSPTVKVITS